MSSHDFTSIRGYQGAVSIRKTVLLGMVIPMLKIRCPTSRLIFNMGILIPGKTVFYIEMGPWITAPAMTARHHDLPHLPLDKMAAISQMIFSDAFL